MLSEATINEFIERIKEYTNLTYEIEIQMEFYGFLKEYYRDMNNIKVKFTAPYHCDGLIEIYNTNDETVYKVLMETKINKNYHNKCNIDSVLAQTIEYCNLMQENKDRLPDIILLVENSTMAIINTEDIKEFIQYANKSIMPSSSFRENIILKNKLNSTNYSYQIIDLYDANQQNNAFNNIHEIGEMNASPISEVNKIPQIEQALMIYIEENTLVNYNGTLYSLRINDDSPTWEIIAPDILLMEIIKYCTFTNYQTFAQKNNSHDVYNLLLSKIKLINNVDFIKINNQIINIYEKYAINITTSEIPFFVKSIWLEKYHYMNEYEDNINMYPLSQELLFGVKGKNTLIITDIETMDNLYYIMGIISPIPMHKKYNILFHNIKEDISYKNININNMNIIKIDKKHSRNELLTLIVNSITNKEHYELVNSRLKTELFNENDLFLAWFNNTLEIKTNNIVLLQDAFNSYNNWLRQRGYSLVSLRCFINDFTNHNSIINNKIKYFSKSAVKKDLIHSPWKDTNKSDISPRIAKKRDSFFLGISFKSDS